MHNSSTKTAKMSRKRKMRWKDDSSEDCITSESEISWDEFSEDEAADDKAHCKCGEANTSNMIGCDNPRCKYEWLHFQCAAIDPKNVPKGKWMCDDCILKEEEGRMPTGQFIVKAPSPNVVAPNPPPMIIKATANLAPVKLTVPVPLRIIKHPPAIYPALNVGSIPTPAIQTARLNFGKAVSTSHTIIKPSTLPQLDTDVPKESKLLNLHLSPCLQEDGKRSADPSVTLVHELRRARKRFKVSSMITQKAKDREQDPKTFLEPWRYKILRANRRKSNPTRRFISTSSIVTPIGSLSSDDCSSSDDSSSSSGSDSYDSDITGDLKEDEFDRITVESDYSESCTDSTGDSTEEMEVQGEMKS